MTSSGRTARRCYVYLALPGQTEMVTCGRIDLARSVGRFVYARRYLERADAVAIDPVELKLAPRVYETAAHGGLFAALRDAGPDDWGRRVMERHAGKQPHDELDYLLHAPDDRAGALGFGLEITPPPPRRQFNQVVQLARLQEIADAVVEGAKVPLKELLQVGTSMGGARPKAVVEDAEGLWLAKFNRKGDRFNRARVESAMLSLGRSCGIATARSKVVEIAGRDVLLVRRFDRETAWGGYQRARQVSARTLLHAGDEERERGRWSYVQLAEELRRVCAQPRQEAAELFRRMCFNALISNLEDEPRNHAIIAWKGDWSLSPAYDLTPVSSVRGDRRDLAMVCGDHGRWASAANLATQAARFLLSPGEAESTIAEMLAKVRGTWHSVARAEGVTEADCAAIAGAFAYPGFSPPAGGH
jgi:serine/threonine-protein kinase HipA